MSTLNSGNASPCPIGNTSVGKAKLSIPEVKKPNVAEMRANIQERQKQLDALVKELGQLTEKINVFTKGNTKFSSRRDDLRKSLDEVQASIDQLENERNKIMLDMEDSVRTGRDMKAKVQTLRKNLGFQSREEIDAKIREVERQMLTSRLSVPEENKLIQQIKALEKSKPLVSQYSAMEIDANNHSENAVIPLRVRRDEIREALRVEQKKRRDLREALMKLMQQRNEAIAPARELSENKDSLKKQIIEARVGLNALRDELFRKEREYETYITRVNRASEEWRVEEKKKAMLEKQKNELLAQLEDIDDEAWPAELRLTQQIVTYLQKLSAKAQSVQAPATVVQPPRLEKNVTKNHLEDGMVIVKPKEERYGLGAAEDGAGEREEVFYFAPTKKKAEKKHRKPAVSPNQPIVHDIATLADFARLNLQPPLSLAECPAALEALEGNLKRLKEEQARSLELVQKRRAELLAKLERKLGGSRFLGMTRELPPNVHGRFYVSVLERTSSPPLAPSTTAREIEAS